jgi:hypothetical protein
MLEAARHSGTFVWPYSSQRFPKVQILTIAELLAGGRPNMPTPFLPYIQARRLANGADQLTLGT